MRGQPGLAAVSSQQAAAAARHTANPAVAPPRRRYFALTTGCNLVLLGSLALAKGGLAAAPPNAAVLLGVAAVASLANMLAVEPLATRLMFERYDLENKPARSEDDAARIKALYKQFGMW